MRTFLAREQRRTRIMFMPQTATSGPTRESMISRWREAAGGGRLRLASDAWQNLNEPLRAAEKNFYSDTTTGCRKYYFRVMGTSVAAGASEGGGLLVGARIFRAEGAGRIGAAAQAAIDGVYLSAMASFSVLLTVFLAVLKRMPYVSVCPEWPELTAQRQSARETDERAALQWPFAPPSKDSLHELMGLTFQTPRVRLLQIGLEHCNTPAYCFSRNMAFNGGPPFLTHDTKRVGNICSVSSVAFLEPVDGRTSSRLTGTQEWEHLATAELRATLQRRINALVWPESPRQIFSAVNDAHNLDWVNALQAEIPSMLDERAVDMHSGIIVVGEDATFVTTRGKIDLFALTVEGLQPVPFGAPRPALRFGDGPRADRGAKDMLMIPHADNEGLILVMSSPGAFDDMSEEGQHRLYRWASSSLEFSNDSRQRNDLVTIPRGNTDFGAVFSRVACRR